MAALLPPLMMEHSTLRASPEHPHVESAAGPHPTTPRPCTCLLPQPTDAASRRALSLSPVAASASTATADSRHAALVDGGQASRLSSSWRSGCGTGSAAAARLGARPAGSWEDDTDAAHAPAAAQSPSPSPLLSPPPPVRPPPGSDDVAAIATAQSSQSKTSMGQMGNRTNSVRGLKPKHQTPQLIVIANPFQDHQGPQPSFPPCTTSFLFQGLICQLG
ncbi:uncharacterized protein LOC120700767 [Panicum virgatum]|uniref:uncharacterized protein LOC120700767 n=1 Tax=Panicum virgatum TaxID=38727 RepID=UPI0019D5FAE5|nr:uncharacterized protein LOC120700767 [Panicum virgatum]